MSQYLKESVKILFFNKIQLDGCFWLVFYFFSFKKLKESQGQPTLEWDEEYAQSKQQRYHSDVVARTIFLLPYRLPPLQNHNFSKCPVWGAASFIEKLCNQKSYVIEIFKF